MKTITYAPPFDGSDDTARIQSLIAMCEIGDTAELPPGVYMTCKPILVPKGVTVKGQGATVVRYRVSGGTG